MVKYRCPSAPVLDRGKYGCPLALVFDCRNLFKYGCLSALVFGHGNPFKYRCLLALVFDCRNPGACRHLYLNMAPVFDHEHIYYDVGRPLRLFFCSLFNVIKPSLGSI
jgi:hypothetical protein